MRHVMDYASAGARAPVLVTLLPGAMHGPADFIAAGFPAAVRERKLALDLCMVELEFGQVADERAMHDLHATLTQLQAQAYEQVWLAGISIGGYVAAAYARHYPQALHGLLLIAPYPGNRMTTEEIRRAGGLGAWQPENVDAVDTERQNWLWLKQQAGSLEVHLAYGEDDRFAASHAMMAQALPASRVARVAGGHDWPAWQALWGNFLDRQPWNHQPWNRPQSNSPQRNRQHG